MAEDRHSYLVRRAGEARVLAEQATDERVRNIHLELAVRYEVQAKAARPAADITDPDDDFD